MPGCLSKAFSSLHTTNLTPRPSRWSKLPSPLRTAECTPVALSCWRQELPGRPTPGTHLLSQCCIGGRAILLLKCRLPQSSTEPQAMARQLNRIEGGGGRVENTGSADGFVPPAFRGLKVNSFNDGEMKQAAIYISHTHGCLPSMDNELSAVRGTVGNTRGMGKPPPCTQSSAVCSPATAAEGTERDR